MAYEPDFRDKVAGSHHSGDMRCSKTTVYATCITCKMAPVPGQMYCEHCAAIHRAHRDSEPSGLIDETARLTIHAADATRNVATRTAALAVRTPLAVVNAAVDAAVSGANRTEQYIREIGMTEEEQLERILDHARNEDNSPEDDVELIAQHIMEPEHYAHRIERLSIALADDIENFFFQQSASKASGARVDCTVPTKESTAHSVEAGARAECTCLLCVIKEAAGQMTPGPTAGARAVETPIAEPAPQKSAGEYTDAYRQRYGLTERRRSDARHAAHSDARKPPRHSSKASSGRTPTAAAKSEANPLRDTGFTYRCHNCPNDIFEATRCKVCGEKVPDVYIADVMSAIRPSAAAQFGDAMVEGVMSLNTMFGL